MTIEVENAKEEAREIIEKCIKCGLCRARCPVLRILREEQYSPRGKVIMIENNNFEKMVYMCTLCKACENQCPLNLKLCTAFINVRKALVGQKKELAKNKKMIKNLEETGNIYGIKE